MTRVKNVVARTLAELVQGSTGMSNLVKRIVTAAVLIPLVIATIFLLPWTGTGTVFAIVLLAGAWEWSALAGWRTHARVAFVMVIALSIAGVGVAGYQWSLLICALASVWWLYASVRVVLLQRTRLWPRPSAALWFVHGWAILVPAWLALVELHRSGPSGPALVMLLMVIVWLADIGAYFAGRAFGRRKLASNVSPGKTWEGATGGALSALCAVIGYGLWQLPQQWALLLALGTVTVIVSVFGDLTESAFKRISGIKDSGGLLPGHGGILDRIDSLTAASPMFLLGAIGLGIT